MKNKNNYIVTREIAMKWWNGLSSLRKTQICDTNTDLVGHVLRWETLTGREIEMIYSHFNKKTHLVIDETDNNSSCFAGTLEQCNDFISKQNTFGFKVVPMTKQEIQIHNH